MRNVSQKLHVSFRLLLLAMLLIALLPALPAAADDPVAPADDVAAAGDVSASDLSMSEAKVFYLDGAADQNLFGRTVSVSGDVMVAGAPAYEVDDDLYRGAAFLYGRNIGGPGKWGLIKMLVAGDGIEGDAFGFSVAIYGNTVVVGAPGVGDAVGAAYVFEKDAGGLNMWGETNILTAGPDAEIDARFGASVAIYNSLIVVGADRESLTGPDSEEGAAYIFSRNAGGAGAWGRVKRLTASDASPGDHFGFSAAIFGPWIVIGAPDVDNNAYTSIGAAYVFGRDAGGTGNWGQVTRLIASDPGYEALFGQSVAVSGTTIVVGAGGADVDDNFEQGAAYVFERDQNGYEHWGQTKKLLAPDGRAGDAFGGAVAISGPAIVVGANNASIGEGGSGFIAPSAISAYECGVAYLFGRNTTGPNEWGLMTKLSASDATEYDEYGFAVAIDGETVVVGADRASIGPIYPGAAYIYMPYGLRVNSAGGRYTDQAGNLWLADRSWQAGVPITPGTTPWGYVGGLGRSVTTPIAGTEDDKLYQTERLYTGAARPGYRFVVPNGRYRVTLKYAETYWGVSGKRKFSVMAEKTICFSNYDIYMTVGAKNKAAPDKVCYVEVTDGMLDIDFISVIGQAKADAIYIQQIYK